MSPGTHKNVITDPRGISHEYWFTPTSMHRVSKYVRRAKSPALCPGSPTSWVHQYTYDSSLRHVSTVLPSGRRIDVTYAPTTYGLHETQLELETNEDDRGRVIGRQGRVAKAMRALLGVSRDGADCRLDIVD